jgi:hypothetical protein
MKKILKFFRTNLKGSPFMIKIFCPFLVSLISISSLAQVGLFTPTGGGPSSNANVGINTNVPQFALEVVGNGQAIRNSGSTGYTTLRLFNNINNIFRALEIDYSGSAYASTLLNGGPVGETAAIGTTGAFPLSFGTNNTARMTLASSGYIGIGTITPTAPLDVFANSLWDGTVRANGSSYSSFGLYQSNSLRWAFYNHPGVSNSLLFANAQGQDKMALTQDGNLGIGTLTPGSFKLAVNGKIWGTEVQVALNNPGPDYVFNSDYNLLSLEEIKTYIDKNKHLPEVPSAKEMEANGIQLGEMNMLLLKKVEELTLHMIEHNKAMNKLIKDNENQQTEIETLKARLK